MTRAERIEASKILDAVLSALVAAIGNADTTAAAELRRYAGTLRVEFVGRWAAGTIGTALRECFDAALMSGASLDNLAIVRRTAQAMPATTFAAFVVRHASIRLCLVEEARALAATTIETRSRAEEMLARFNDAFDEAEEVAADVSDGDAYRALVALRCAVVRDIAERAATLPEVIRYEFRRAMPALYIANRLYGDGARADELVVENRARHPAFMPRSGLALTA